jgi:hypothetical protein
MSTKRTSTTSARRENRPPADMPWIWLTREMMESPAWRALGTCEGVNERRVVERLMLEHMAHAGTENGNLVVTYRDFEAYGVRYKSIKTAIAAGSRSAGSRSRSKAKPRSKASGSRRAMR